MRARRRLVEARGSILRREPRQPRQAHPARPAVAQPEERRGRGRNVAIASCTLYTAPPVMSAEPRCRTVQHDAAQRCAAQRHTMPTSFTGWALAPRPGRARAALRQSSLGAAGLAGTSSHSPFSLSPSGPYPPPPRSQRLGPINLHRPQPTPPPCACARRARSILPRPSKGPLLRSQAKPPQRKLRSNSPNLLTVTKRICYSGLLSDRRDASRPQRRPPAHP